MTEAENFYDKLLASIGLPSDESQAPQDYGRKEPPRDQERNSRGERGGSHPLKPPPEPQHRHKPESLPQQKPKHESKKHEPVQKPQLELQRNTGGSTFTLPPKPTTSADELREKLARQLERPPPPPRSTFPPPPPPPPPPQPPTSVTILKPTSEAQPPNFPLLESSRSKDELCKTPAALEAELRRKLLENGRRKRKPSPQPEGRVLKVEGDEKRQKTTPPPVLPSPQLPPPPPPPPLPQPATATAGTENKPLNGESLSGSELIKSRQAELRRKLLERSKSLKQQPPSIQTNGDLPNHKPDPTRKAPNSYSPIEISSDEEGEAPPPSSKSRTLSLLPPFLPPRPPPREGFKLSISVPFLGASNGSIILKTEKLPLSTPISNILGLFGAARNGDHLYFPGSNPKSTAETENAEKAELVLGEEGQRFYRDGDDTGGRDGGLIKEEDLTPPRLIIKKEDGWNPRSAGSSLKGTSSLRGDAIDYIPNGRFKEAAAAVVEPQWTGISATLEDVWTRGKKVVDCTLVRAEDPIDDQDEDHGLPEHHLEDRGNGWIPHHQHRHSRSDFSTGIEHQWGDDQNGEEGELEDDEGEGEGWGYNNEGYPEPGEGGPSMNWGPGYPIGQGHAQGPWNPEPFPMIPNTNIPDPNAQWYGGQHTQYQHSAQPSPVFSQHDEAQGPPFMGGGASVPQHWVPGHMDYASAGWMYGFGPNDTQQNVSMGPGAEPAEGPPSTADEVNKIVSDGKIPGQAQGQQTQHPRVQVGSTKPKRPRGGRQVKKKERRKGGSGGGGVSRSGGGVGAVN